MKLSRNEIITYLISKMLEPHNSSYDEVLANPEIEGLPWYQYYTFNSEEELDNFKKFFIITLTKNTKPAFNKKMAESEWNWFNLMYGLREKFKNEQKLQKESSK